MKANDRSGAGLLPEVRELLEDRSRIGKLATTRKNGNPWLQPVWFALRGSSIIIISTTESLATRSLERSGRAALCVDDETLPYRFVTLECRAELSDSERLVRDYLGQLIAKYRPEIDVVRETGMYLEMGVTAVTLHPDRVFHMPRVVNLGEG